MGLPSGAQLGPYVIRSMLGAGGMGEVYVAYDTRLDRQVALKLLPATLARDSDRLRRFEQEARSASALNHPAIVAIYDLGQADTQPYISMELVEGQTLRQLLHTGAMPARRVLHIAAPIADGLAKAHEAGIVHRDLKPENLMVSRDGFAKILDFGLAKLVRNEGADALQTATAHQTWPGSVVGTVAYMSPEQASGATVDNRSDQFSFGLVLYEMLTGQRAFGGTTAAETMTAIIRDDPTPLGTLNPGVPAPVRWLVERCLAKAPNDRYAATRDLARDLAAARDHFSELTGSGAAPASTAARDARFTRRELAGWSLATVLLLVTILLMVWRERPPTAESNGPMRFQISPPEGVTFFSPFAMSPFAISPDGRHLAFIGERKEGRGLWLHSFETLASRLLPGTEGAHGAFWAPDGRDVAFFTPDGLKRTSIASGEVMRICDARWGGGGTWNHDGVIVFAPATDSPLLRVAATGGTPTPITKLEGDQESGHYGPVFLPDGRHFLFGVVGGATTGTYVASLEGTERKRLSPEMSPFGFAAPDFLLFVRDGTLMVQRLDLSRLDLVGEPIQMADAVEHLGPGASFSVSASGTLIHSPGARNITQPTWVRRDGTAEGTLGRPGEIMNVALSADGKQAAVDRFDELPGIWLLDTTRGTETRATFGKVYESTPVWSPDGAAFAFAFAESTPPNLYVKRLDATGPVQHLFGTPSQTLFPQSWSSDGRFLAYASTSAATEGDIWLLELTGAAKPKPLVQTRLDDAHARISPNGRWLAYTSSESGREDVYVTRFPDAAGKLSISPSGGAYPVWRRDGRELFYRALDGKLMAVPVSASDDFTPGLPIPLFDSRTLANTLGYGTPYDVAPDGRFLINVLVRQTSPPATIVLNWRAGVAPP